MGKSSRWRVLGLWSCHPFERSTTKILSYSWVSRKVKRHVPSTLAGEALAMRDALDDAIYLGSIMTELYCNNYHVNELPVVAYTYNKSLHENLHSMKQVREK